MEPDLELDVPQWLDNVFIETLLREDENDQSITVLSIDVRLAVGKGDNYVSRLYRVTVNLNKGGLPQQRWLIVKCLSDSEMFVKFAVDVEVFEKETRMHLETLPSMYQLEENCLPNEKTLPPLSCKTYQSTRPYTIVMEDLQHLGFKMANRLEGLDLKHSILAIRALARLHSLSWGLLDKDPKSIESYVEKMYCKEFIDINPLFITSGISLLSAEVARWEGYEHLAVKLKEAVSVDKVLEQFKIKDGGLAVLNHGDTWLNNMMFKYNESGEVEDVRLLDLQMARYSSPALDIQYYMHTSPSEEVRTKHWDDVIEAYHQAFVTSVQSLRLGRKIPTLEEIKKELEDKMLFGLFTACTVLPIVLASPDDVPDTSEMTMDSMADEENMEEFGKTFRGLRFKRAFQKILVHFENIGIL